MRMNYYPPCPQPELAIGLTPHSDFGGLTILLQINKVEGLQINKEERWISVKPLPNAFVVNVGDVLEIMTNGIYRSVDHRAVVNSTKKRLSIATFHDPRSRVGNRPNIELDHSTDTCFVQKWIYVWGTCGGISFKEARWKTIS
ncbi:probable 2-oxoglutarate/Fe(II)-dependent dioxygenase [Papaver somniferum]|uniref:probable 2-oxoglutarate/Fe(II)-dependent dioxygenase n=1 Tax=Papaver somniferum TaxID=3469 RepID=UPI000E6F9488|nr:probable 2-oxoglutarate/Fe(II)-dependent dioxygenase [Papaver somniferum]